MDGRAGPAVLDPKDRWDLRRGAHAGGERSWPSAVGAEPGMGPAGSRVFRIRIRYRGALNRLSLVACRLSLVACRRRVARAAGARAAAGAARDHGGPRTPGRRTAACPSSIATARAGVAA